MRRVPVLVVAAAAVAAAVSGAGATTTATPPKPSFVSYQSPPGIGDNAGEPTLGVHHYTGAILFQAGTDTLRVTGLNGRGGATWEEVTPYLPGMYTFDPMLEMDPVTGRTFVSQLDLYCSRMAYTDNAGQSWTQVPLGCGAGTAFDHQMVGVGRFRGDRDPDAYPNAVYYCAQATLTAMCATSTDGGYTYGVATVAWRNGPCSTQFGHLKSAPDGTAYLPPRSCGNQAGIYRTSDDGKTWNLRQVPDSTSGDAMHPSVGVGSDGTVYFAWGGKDGTGPGGAPYVAVSRDRAESWSEPRRLGGELGIVNTRFVTTVAGDGDRAAVAFLGSRTPGSADAAAFAGEWHLYVSFTYDRGATWTTVNATPRSPVQVGAICTGGVSCTGHRNLLDFNDLVIDGRGRVVAAIADGCPYDTCLPGSSSEKATVVRQETGRGLLRRYDPR